MHYCYFLLFRSVASSIIFSNLRFFRVHVLHVLLLYNNACIIYLVSRAWTRTHVIRVNLSQLLTRVKIFLTRVSNL